MKLTKRVVDGIEPGDKTRLVWDADLPGFGLRVTASGAKSYLVQYRTAQGRSRRLTIGRHGVFSPDQARLEARQILAAVAKGDDPAAERQAARQAPTVAELCDRYLSEHVEVHNKPGTAEGCRGMIRHHVLPAMGSLKAAGVTRQDVLKLHRSMKATPRGANHVLAVLSKMFTLAELWSIRPDGSNPCRLVKRYPEARRERFLSEEELARLGAAMDRAEREQTAQPDAMLAIRVLALSGCRLGEVVNLKWEHVDFEAGALVLPDAKAGARTHALGAPALAILEAIPRVEGSPWVFHAKTTEKVLSRWAVDKCWRRLKKAAGLEDARLHDLRHTVGTYAGATGANAFLIRDKLGHKTLAMTGRYVSPDADPLRVLSDRVESVIDGAMRGKPGGDVVPLRPAGRPRGA